MGKIDYVGVSVLLIWQVGLSALLDLFNLGFSISLICSGYVLINLPAKEFHITGSYILSIITYT
jgi:hypothetical protein